MLERFTVLFFYTLALCSINAWVSHPLVAALLQALDHGFLVFYVCWIYNNPKPGLLMLGKILSLSILINLIVYFVKTYIERQI